MTEAAEIDAPSHQVVNPPVDDDQGSQDAALRRQELSARAKAALLNDLRALWRDCSQVMQLCETVGKALDAGQITQGEARDYLGPDFLIWMLEVGGNRQRIVERNRRLIDERLAQTVNVRDGA